MSGIKYVLKNNTLSSQFFDYKTLSDGMWIYQVQLNPGQIKTIWAETGTLKIYNNGAITIEEQSVFPPTNTVIGGNTGTKTQIDYKNKSVLIFSTISGSTNLGYSVLDFEHNVIVGPVDLGYNTGSVSGGYWQVNDVYPFTNSGYVIYLYNSENDNTASIYLDYKGTIVGEYSASTSGSTYGISYGKFAHFIDYQNFIFNYSDGKTFKSKSISPDYMFEVVNGFWDGNNNNSFVTFLSGGTYNSYTLITMDREIPLVSWDNTYNQMEVFQYDNSNFTTTLNYTIDDYYTFFNIYSSTGSMLQSIDLTTDNQYDSSDFTFFGTNKMNIIFYNGGEGGSNIPYLIYTYDGETDTLISTTHVNNGDYPGWNQNYNSLYGGERIFPSQDFHISFYNQVESIGDFYVTSYYDVLSYFSGDTEYRTPYVINSGDTTNQVTIFDEFLGSSLMFFYRNGDGYIKLLVITPDDTFTTNVTPEGPLNEFIFFNWFVGDTFIFTTFTNYDSDGTIYAYDAMGNQLDYKLFYNGFNNNNSYGTFYFETDPGAYYFNTANSKFTSINYQESTNRVGLYYTNTFKLIGNMLLSNYNEFGHYSRLLTENNLTSEVVLPTANCCFTGLHVGKDVILYVYINDNQNVVINLYNLSFGLLKSLVVTEGSINNTWVVENRAFVEFLDGSIYTNYMVSANGIKMVKSTTSYNYITSNDYYSWND